MMEEIILDLKMLKEDRPNVIITDEIIKEYILDNINYLIEEIRKEVRK